MIEVLLFVVFISMLFSFYLSKSDDINETASKIKDILEKK